MWQTVKYNFGSPMWSLNTSLTIFEKKVWLRKKICVFVREARLTKKVFQYSQQYLLNKVTTHF
jgi:hypothetical protein